MKEPRDYEGLITGIIFVVILLVGAASIAYSWRLS